MLMRKMFKVVRFSIDELAHLNAFEISKDTIPRKIETLAFFRLSECVFHVVCVCVCVFSFSSRTNALVSALLEAQLKQINTMPTNEGTQTVICYCIFTGNLIYMA